MKSKQKFGSSWTCPNCKEDKVYEHAEMMAHIRDVHKIETKGAKGSRSMMMHLDGADYFHSTFEWTIAGMKFIQSITTEREKNDLMRLDK